MNKDNSNQSALKTQQIEQVDKDNIIKDHSQSHMQLLTQLIKIKTEFGKEIIGRVYSYEENKILILSNYNQVIIIFLEIIDKELFDQNGEEQFISIGVYHTSTLQPLENGQMLELVSSQQQYTAQKIDEEFSHSDELIIDWIENQEIEKLQKQGHLSQYKQ